MARIALIVLVLIGFAAGASAREAKIGQASIDLVTTFVGVLAEDSTACYTALLQKLKTETGSEKTQTAINATTVVKGKVVYFYLFSLYTGRDSIDAALAKQKVNLGAFIAANKN